jgi:EAL domain-containing protein (putative c-di-GMP-specific phosphodiesterase class I)
MIPASRYRLKFEITETAFLCATVTRFSPTRRHGIRVAIDDFDGYSSLNSLRLYPVDTIKIDAEFGARSARRRRQAVSGIAGYLPRGAEVIAEGVETAAQHSLRASGCDFGQGYLFADAMDGALFGAYAFTHAVRPVPSGRGRHCARPGAARWSIPDIKKSVAGQAMRCGKAAGQRYEAVHRSVTTTRRPAARPR